MQGNRPLSSPRPERDEAGAPPASAVRPDAPARAAAVCGPAGVLAQVELQLSQCRRRGGGLALVSVSIETVSRAGGPASAALEQRVRQEAAHRIGNAVRAGDLLLRESERDTCVALPGADAATAQRVGRRLERLVGGDYRIAGELLAVAVRVGRATYPEDGVRAADLLRRAGERR